MLQGLLVLSVALLPVAPAAGASSGRIAGASRIDTAIAISKEAFPQGAPRVYLARQDVFADALSAGTLADGPTLLVPSCGEAPLQVLDEVARQAPQEVVALGGTAAVCEGMLQQVAAAAGATAARLAGPTRLETATAISGAAFPDGAAEVYLAAAADSPDALAAGALTGGPVLLVPNAGGLPDVVRSEIERLDPERIYAIGTGAEVSQQAVGEAAETGAEVERLDGNDLFERAAQVARLGFAPPVDRIYLVRSDVIADGVSAGSLQGGPVVFVPSCGDLPPPIAELLEQFTPAEVIALGGPAAVCEDLLARAAALAGDAPGEPGIEQVAFASGGVNPMVPNVAFSGTFGYRGVTSNSEVWTSFDDLEEADVQLSPQRRLVVAVTEPTAVARGDIVVRAADRDLAEIGRIAFAGEPGDLELAISPDDRAIAWVDDEGHHLWRVDESTASVVDGPPSDGLRAHPDIVFSSHDSGSSVAFCRGRSEDLVVMDSIAGADVLEVGCDSAGMGVGPDGVATALLELGDASHVELVGTQLQALPEPTRLEQGSGVIGGLELVSQAASCGDFLTLSFSSVQGGALARDVVTDRTFFLPGQAPKGSVFFTCPAIAPGNDYYAPQQPAGDPALVVDTRDGSTRQISESGTVVAMTSDASNVLVTRNGLFNVAEGGSAQEVDLATPDGTFDAICQVGGSDVAVLFDEGDGGSVMIYDLRTGASQVVETPDPVRVGFCATDTSSRYLVSGNVLVDMEDTTVRSLAVQTHDLPGGAYRTVVRALDPADP